MRDWAHSQGNATHSTGAIFAHELSGMDAPTLSQQPLMPQAQSLLEKAKTLNRSLADIREKVLNNKDKELESARIQKVAPVVVSLENLGRQLDEANDQIISILKRL